MKKLVENNYVNLELLKELMKSKVVFTKNIDKKIHSVPIHCYVCGITKPKHGFYALQGLACGVEIYQTSPYICNKCGLDNDEVC